MGFVYIFEENLRLLLAIFTGFFTITLLFYLQKNTLHKINENHIARHLNLHYPQLENSTDLLLLNENNLSGLAQIQR